jgi:imidazolonepropionase-like amidohydrolase
MIAATSITGPRLLTSLGQINENTGDPAKIRARVNELHAEGARAAVNAGCTTIEHGTFIDDATLQLMAAKGTFFDPNFLVLHNYLDNQPKFLGIGNYNDEGFAYMEKALPLVAGVLRRARKAHLKIVNGSDGVAGAHGRNAEELIHRVRDGGDTAMDALTSATSVSAESMRMGDQIGTLGVGMEADIIGVLGDPITDIAALRRVGFVMKHGAVYKFAPQGN